MTTRIIRVPTLIVVPGKPIGRNIHHDPRSQNFRVKRTAVEPVNQFYKATNKIALNQRDLGACVGFSTAQNFNCHPFNLHLTEEDARTAYHLATMNDPFPGIWPPDDTGSDGLSGMKAAVDLGWCKSFSNCFDIDDVIAALQTRPGTTGTYWYEGFDNPDPVTGLVRPTGLIRGGHQYTIVGVDLDQCLIWFRTSWENFGVKRDDADGYFCMHFNAYQSVLGNYGDATFPDVP